MKPLTTLLPIITGIALWAITESCTNKEKPVDANVNTAFEMAPPVAEDIQVKLLEKPIDGANVLVTARLDRKLIKGNLHALMVNDEKLILRDDGKKGDEKAEDGIFSIALKEDEAALQKDMESFRQAGIKQLRNNQPLFQWVNRSAIPINDKIKNLELDKFDLKRGFRFDPALFFTLPPDPALKDHSLMVTDLGVVEDLSRTFNPCTGVGTAMSAWTFGKLMGDMVNGTVPVQDFLKDWLDTWMNPGSVNSDPIPARTSIFTQIIRPWILKTDPAIPPVTITPANWKTFALDLKFAPFKLLAIVNRIDLRGNSGYTISNAGEGRFVFGALSSSCSSLLFTVIFEYGVPKKTCASLKAYAQQWYDLKSLTPGTAAYNTALQTITDQFTAAGAGGAGKANGSSLNQVRTNEIALSFPWELREFNIDAATHKLFLTTVKQEPAEQFNRNSVLPAGVTRDVATLAKYVNSNEPSILANTYKVPPSIGALPFLGGKAHTEGSGHFWDASTAAGPEFITNDNARQVFSLNTCSGCHGGEARTTVGNLINDPAGVPHKPFLQIAPQPFGTKATLSAFLTGDPGQADGLFKVTDPAGRPAGSPTVRGFNDLQRRAVDLEVFVHTICVRRRIPELIRVLTFKPVHMTH